MIDMSRMRWTREEVEAYVSGWNSYTRWPIHVADFDRFGPAACRVSTARPDRAL